MIEGIRDRFRLILNNNTGIIKEVKVKDAWCGFNGTNKTHIEDNGAAELCEAYDTRHWWGMCG